MEGQLDVYRLCDNSWTFQLEGINSKLNDHSRVRTENMQVVSCASKSSSSQRCDAHDALTRYISLSIWIFDVFNDKGGDSYWYLKRLRVSLLKKVVHKDFVSRQDRWRQLSSDAPERLEQAYVRSNSYRGS